MTGAAGFIGRWSRRKAGIDEAPRVALPTAPVATAPPLPVVADTHADADADADAAVPEAAIPLPSMVDVAALTRESDFAPFVRSGVEPGVRNAAMKKLFSDPHFNIMDGLDTYIDDYSQPDPIPPAMLRLMNQAASLGLFDDEEEGAEAKAAAAAAAALACPDGSPAMQRAQSFPTEPDPNLRPDDDPDLRLQQDDAAGRPGAGPGARA